MSDGHLTREQFNNGINKFVEKCQLFNENWCVHHVEDTPEQRYLVKRQTFAATVEDETKVQNLVDDTEEYLVEENTFDGANVLSVCSNTEQLKEIVTFEYHVIYSPSYSVPVLYFSAWTQDGKLLSLDNIWKQVPEIHQDFLNYDKWSFITQQEHPLFQRPYFVVHPCHTADFMKQLVKNTSGCEKDPSWYLTTWLSAVGPAVGIRLPLQFALFQDKI